MAQFSLQYFNLFPNTFISVALRYKDNNIISSQKNVPSTFRQMEHKKVFLFTYYSIYATFLSSRGLASGFSSL